MVEELKLAIKIDDATIEQSLLKQFANAQKMADKIVLDFKNVNFDDKQIEAKFKEMQKKAGQNPIDLTIGGNTLDMLGQIDKRLTEIFSVGKGKSFIDSSSITADIERITDSAQKLSNILDKSFNVKNKIEAFNQLKEAYKDYNEIDLTDGFDKAGVEAAYSFWKSYEEAINKNVAESRLEAFGDIKQNKRSLSDGIIDNYKQILFDYKSIESEITKNNNGIFPFLDDYTIKDINNYVYALYRIREAEKDIQEINKIPINQRDEYNLEYLSNAKGVKEYYQEQANTWHEWILSSIQNQGKLQNELKETREEIQKTDNILNTTSSSNNDSQIEDLKSDIAEVKTELGEVKDRISNIESNSFENIREDVEKTKESVKELNSELTEMKSNLSSTPQESNISSEKKDAFPDKDVSASVESATNSIKEENTVLEQNTQKVKENTQAKEQNANVNINKYDKRLDSYNGKVDKYQATIDRFNDGGWTSKTYLENVQAVRDAVKQYATLLNNIKTNQNGIATDEDIQNLDKYEKKIKDTIATVTNMSASEKGYSQLAGQKEIDKINKILRENSAMSSEAKAKIKAYKQELISGNPSVSLEKIHGEIMKIVNAEELAGRAGRSFFDILKNSGFHQLAAQMAGMFGFYDVINLGKEAISTIVSLDDALVDLKKTTAMNSTQLEDFYYDANDVAKQMGVTTEEIITQASAWSRLGYSSQEAATTMAKLSSKFASISPGMSTDEAQEGLVSIMKAFDIDPDDVETEIMDKVNVLGNKFAEENQDVIEGLKRSAAAMSAMGQSFTDTAALFTGGMEILQDSESMGTALRTLSMRVRGYDEETNQLSDDLVNVTGEVADLTKTAQDSQGVSLFTDATQEHYRSMVKYLGDIADRWDQISEKNQTELLQKLFGKNRANAGAAIIQNFDQVRAAIEAMDKSAGSSEAEMSEIESSLSYKINALKETWVGCVQDMVDRGDLGTIVTGLIKVSEAVTFLLDKLGILGSIGLGAGIFSGIKNVGIDMLVAY